MKHIRILLWIAGLSLAIIAPIQFYRIHRAFGFISIGGLCLMVLPPILIISIAYMLKLIPRNGVIHGLSFVGLIGILLCYALLSLGLEDWISARPISDLQKYEKILNKWKQLAPDIVSHFPEPIPSSAQNIGFYFAPGFLQADSEIQLRFKIATGKINEYYEEFSKLKTKSYYGRTLVHYLPHKKEGELIELGEDFETLQFDNDPNHITEHGKEHGVIISKEKNEIIFWAEW